MTRWLALLVGGSAPIATGPFGLPWGARLVLGLAILLVLVFQLVLTYRLGSKALQRVERRQVPAVMTALMEGKPTPIRRRGP